MKSLVLYVALIFGVLTAFGQKIPETSLYILHQPFVNPASVSKYGSMSGAFSFKQQWVGYEGAPQSLFANFNMPLKRDRTAGGLISNDKLGIHNTFKIQGLYAQKFRIDRTSFFSLAVTPGIDLLQNDYAAVQTDYANDPLFSGNSVSMFSVNMGAGGYYYAKKLYAGIAIPEFFYNHFEAVNPGENKGKLTLNLKNMPLYFMGGWKTDVGKFITLKPSSMVRYQPGSALQVDVTCLAEYREQIGFGITYRTLNSLNFIASYQINRDFKVGYGYNTQLGSQLNTYNSGTHEIGLMFGTGNMKRSNVNLPKKIKKYKKAKLKEIQKAMKATEKERKKKDKDAVPLEPGGKRKKQPYR
ncbi:MAG: type IX secretion system membrane protein PorP/SprF [Flavobacteriales bacterium]|nr:type IX secretion system membrane protein PorP/SprF [Flavobacteriales bacterium]